MSTKPFRRIALTARSDFPEKEKVLQEIVDCVKKGGATVSLLEQPATVSKDTDLIIVIGGDGTILATVRTMGECAAPILGIHGGTLGLLTTLHAHEIRRDLPPLLAGEGVLDERQLLAISLEEHGEQREVGRVLNEAVISQGGIARLLHLKTTIDGEMLATFRADGLIMATPTGSTAYSLAAGGTIVHPNVREATTILTPINPHSFFQKPLIVPGSSDVAVRVLTETNAYRTIHPVLTLDGQMTYPLDHNQTVHACASDRYVRFLRRKKDTFYETIRRKLGWGERVAEHAEAV